MSDQDPLAELLKDTKAPWYVRLGWKMKKGEIMAWLASLLKGLNGNNRIIALLLLVVVGAVRGLGGPDLTSYMNSALSLLGLNGEWLKDLGLSYSPAEVAFWAYATFASLFALWKRWKATGQVMLPGGAFMPPLIPPPPPPPVK